jgi:hypothetical protein
MELNDGYRFIFSRKSDEHLKVTTILGGKVIGSPV